MAFKFNPFTGTLDYYEKSTLPPSQESHFNFYQVDAIDTVTVKAGQENVITSPQIIDGILIIDGRNTVIA
jgi:hypothetical protein